MNRAVVFTLFSLVVSAQSIVETAEWIDIKNIPINDQYLLIENAILDFARQLSISEDRSIVYHDINSIDESWDQEKEVLNGVELENYLSQEYTYSSLYQKYTNQIQKYESLKIDSINIEERIERERSYTLNLTKRRQNEEAILKISSEILSHQLKGLGFKVLVYAKAILPIDRSHEQIITILKTQLRRNAINYISKVISNNYPVIDDHISESMYFEELDSYDDFYSRAGVQKRSLFAITYSVYPFWEYPEEYIDQHEMWDSLFSNNYPEIIVIDKDTTDFRQAVQNLKKEYTYTKSIKEYSDTQYSINLRNNITAYNKIAKLNTEFVQTQNYYDSIATKIDSMISMSDQEINQLQAKKNIISSELSASVRSKNESVNQLEQMKNSYNKTLSYHITYINDFRQYQQSANESLQEAVSSAAKKSLIYLNDLQYKKKYGEVIVETSQMGTVVTLLSKEQVELVPAIEKFKILYIDTSFDDNIIVTNIAYQIGWQLAKHFSYDKSDFIFYDYDENKEWFAPTTNPIVTTELENWYDQGHFIPDSSELRNVIIRLIQYQRHSKEAIFREIFETDESDINIISANTYVDMIGYRRYVSYQIDLNTLTFKKYDLISTEMAYLLAYKEND